MKKVKGWLLDTHALLWMLYGDQRLSVPATEAIDGDLLLYASVASFWEIAIKQGSKGFDFEIESTWDESFQIELKRIGVSLLDISVSDCRLVQDLPMHHRDPFDRILIAQAINHQLGVLTRDRSFADYQLEVRW